MCADNDTILSMISSCAQATIGLLKNVKVNISIIFYENYRKFLQVADQIMFVMLAMFEDDSQSKLIFLACTEG
jgi:hypothetical protein